MNAEQCLFWLFATLACGGAISVAICQSVVRMAMSLIVCLASVSAVFFMLHADFVGAVQLMVYVGGTIVLLIFGIMLTASAPFLKIRASPAEGFLAAGIGVFFLAVIAFTVGGISDVEWASFDRNLAGLTTPSDVSSGYNDSSSGNTTRPLALSFLGLRPDKGGNAPGYLLPFEIVSVHLLVVLIGAAYLARSKRRVSTAELGDADVASQHSLPRSPFAGGSDRLGAALIDALILIVVLSVVEFALASQLLDNPSLDTILLQRDFLSASGVIFCLLEVTIPWLYFALMESSRGQATFGKQFFGLTVCDYDNQRISFKRATVRLFSKILSEVLLLIGYVMIPFTPRAQGLHDYIAKTLVTRQ